MKPIAWLALSACLWLSACSPEPVEFEESAADRADAAALSAQVESARASEQAARDAQRLQDLWDYQAVQAAGGVQRSAAIYSRTVAVEDGELLPAPDARLVLRDHPEWGRSAYLLLEQSRFSCGRPCKLKLSFDDSSTLDFAGRQADSGKGPALFIKDEKRFLQALSGARKLRIQLPEGSGRLNVLVFEVAGFQSDRYERAKLTRQP